MAETKEDIFLSEPIGDKTTDWLPGIEEEDAIALEKKGFETAYQLLGQFLLLKQDEFLFVEWLKLFEIKDNAAVECYKCLKAWVDRFM
ncbi:barrier-to-autointegration factor A-like protein [Leptotrombidium deliense]|uniref:Barrier-to-autointegration factor A-like protein n=1 Tax=Leptotrombidium deliense TaxID=299467 RepID=A0A443SL51_9ACAR|nr:barrier-to-autointegration factor A-like protein [Leptotrombidium deliense]